MNADAFKCESPHLGVIYDRVKLIPVHVPLDFSQHIFIERLRRQRFAYA